MKVFSKVQYVTVRVTKNWSLVHKANPYSMLRFLHAQNLSPAWLAALGTAILQAQLFRVFLYVEALHSAHLLQL